MLLKRYTEGSKYAGSTYGNVTKEEILEKMNIIPEKDKSFSENKIYDNVTDQLNQSQDQIIANNEQQDKDEIWNELLRLLGINPTTLQPDSVIKETGRKNEKVIEQFYSLVNQEIQKQNSAIGEFQNFHKFH